MKQTDAIPETSLIYFHDFSQRARDFLFYPLVAGIYEKGADYYVHRESYDSIMIACVLQGKLYLNQDGQSLGATSGDLLLVDCYREHEYFTDSFVKFLWVHIDGATCRAWLEAIKSTRGQCIRASSACPSLLLSVIDGIKSGESEYRLSQSIHALLCEIAAHEEETSAEEHLSIVKQAKEYMEAHLDQRLTVGQIAEQMHYSPSYFSMIFKQATHLSPYEYLLSRRLERAKGLLLQTKLPLDIVSAQSGFHSVPHFICAFKQATGFSPLKFRKLKF